MRYGADSLAQPRPDLSRRDERLKARRVDALLRIGPAHVVDHDLGREIAKERIEVGVILDVEQELHMPAEILDALGELARDIEVKPGLGGAVDAKAAHARLGEIAQRAVGDVLVDQRDGAQPFRDAP